MSCYIWYNKEGPGRTAAPPSPLLTVPNVTAHPSTGSVPITVLLYDGLLLCGINVAIKVLKSVNNKNVQKTSSIKSTIEMEKYIHTVTATSLSSSIICTSRTILHAVK